MYTVAKLADVVQIHPKNFDKSSEQAIEDFINEKYSNKVIHRVGLCLGLYSILSCSEGNIGHGDGLVYVNVDFQIIVFRPFKGEILVAKIDDYNPQGIYLSMGFFGDIVVPPSLLFENTHYEKDEGGQHLFIWRSDDGEGGENQFFFDKAETVMFRVEQEIWNDLAPQMQRPEDFDIYALDQYGQRTPPYRIIGSMMHSGLGPTLWWQSEDGPQEGEDTEMS